MLITYIKIYVTWLTKNYGYHVKKVERTVFPKLLAILHSETLDYRQVSVLQSQPNSGGTKTIANGYHVKNSRKNRLS